MTTAVVLTAFGAPNVLRLADVEVPAPRAAQIRVAVRVAGVGPTDLGIRAGALEKAFPVRPGAVLGFEVAGTVESVGDDVRGVAVGDEVAAFLPDLGGYASLVLADHWVRKPAAVSWDDAAALPSSGEAAVRVLNQLSVGADDTVLILGGTGSVGRIAVQVAVARGARVVAAVRRADFSVVERFGAVPVEYGPGLTEAVRAAVGSGVGAAGASGGGVDAVVNAASRPSDLAAAVELAGGPQRVLSLTGGHDPALGVALSEPDRPGINAALAEAMTRLADGGLSLRAHEVVALGAAADAHARLEAGERRKFLLKVV